MSQEEGFFVMTRRFNLVNQKPEGFSLLGIIVSIGLAGIATYGVTSGLVVAKKAQKNATLKESFQTVQPALRTALARAARDFVFEKKCGDPAEAASLRIGESFSNVPILSVGSSGSAKISAVTSVTPPHPNFAEAADRCAGQSIRNYSNQNVGAGTLMYTCLSLTADSSLKNKLMTSSSSFWSMNNSFVELLVLPIDLRQDEPRTCATVDSPGGGLKVLYTVYFSGLQSSGGSPNRADGVFYVTKE